VQNWDLPVLKLCEANLLVTPKISNAGAELM